MFIEISGKSTSSSWYKSSNGTEKDCLEIEMIKELYSVQRLKKTAKAIY